MGYLPFGETLKSGYEATSERLGRAGHSLAYTGAALLPFPFNAIFSERTRGIKRRAGGGILDYMLEGKADPIGFLKKTLSEYENRSTLGKIFSSDNNYYVSVLNN